MLLVQNRISAHDFHRPDWQPQRLPSVPMLIHLSHLIRHDCATLLQVQPGLVRPQMPQQQQAQQQQQQQQQQQRWLQGQAVHQAQRPVPRPPAGL